jgi:hypothetical protein
MKAVARRIRYATTKATKSLPMADRVETEIPHEQADESKVAVPPNAETPSIPEISVPMLEVHSPHEALHTWKGFFIHIATIVVGLFIAVGLEQAVELVHHRYQVAEMREVLRLERDTNRKNVAKDSRFWRWETAELKNNLLVLQYIQQHPGTPQERCPAFWYGAIAKQLTTAPRGILPIRPASRY